MATFPTFEPGQLYRRRELHAAWGGSYQSGISFSKRAPVIFIFTGDTGHQFGYRDGPQPDGTWHYTGEGQVGDMTFTRGNLAIRAHLDDEHAVYLFARVDRPAGHVRFIGRVRYADHRLVEGVPDRDGTPRRAIVFVLEPVTPDDAAVPDPPLSPDPATDEDATDEDAAVESYEDQRPPWDDVEDRLLAIQQLRVAEGEPADLPPGPRSPDEDRTSRTSRLVVLRRARGRCEGCGAGAPFRRADGSPYLEPHNLSRASDQALDGPDRVVALCPNCHRRAHFADDGEGFNAGLSSRRPGTPG